MKIGSGHFLWLGFVLLVAAQRSFAAPIVFSVMGDVPYHEKEYGILTKQVASLPKEAAFALHVGDIKKGHWDCEPDRYTRVRSILEKSPVPFFIIPGDNEYNDCSDPDEGWALWVKYFLRFDERFTTKLGVQRQSIREENFALVIGDVLFMSLNILGGRIHDKAEWARREKDNVAWFKALLESKRSTVKAVVFFSQAFPKGKGYLAPMEAAAATFGKPILHIHGDGHTWIIDKPYQNAKNISRIQVTRGGLENPLRVVVDTKATNPFAYQRTGKP